MPILNGLLRLLIHIDALQLHQRNGKLALLRAKQHKHLMHTFLFGSHAYHLDFITCF
jgi:hypothetical protein